MSVTLTIDESLLRDAEQATNIHDWPTLVTKGLQALCQPSAAGMRPSQAPFDFDDALAAAAALPDLPEEEFDRLAKEMNAPLPPAW
jgi:hypothetical protein